MEEGSKPSLSGRLFSQVSRKLFLGFLVVALLVVISGFISHQAIQGLVQEEQSKSSITGASIVSFAKGQLTDSSKAGFLVTLTSLLIGTLAITLGLSISRSVSKPIKELQKATKELKEGNFAARVDINTHDELEELGESFNATAEALGQMEAQRKQLDRAKTEFLSITSHELRSPMTPMKAQLQMLTKGYFGNLTEKQKKALGIVLRNTTRLDNILMDFLDLSRIEAARLKFHFIKTNMKKHIESLIEEMKGFMPEKNIELIAKIGKLPAIEVDPDRVMQVLRNLINNAIKFSNPNGKLFVNVDYKDNMIVFSVRDAGIGIASENQKHIFEPFFQEEQTMYRKYGGTGLGLALCKGIILSQKGMIWVRSALGKGTTFYFTVPLKPVKEVKPIKLLFSHKGIIEKRLKEAFIEYLGPLGGPEYEMINKNGPKYDIIVDHLRDLKKKKIMDGDMLRQMIRKIDSVFDVTISV